jgi:hypothetical protein
MFPLLLIGYSVISIWQQYKKEELQIAVLLGGAFLALNVFVVVHIVVIVLLLALLKLD